MNVLALIKTIACGICKGLGGGQESEMLQSTSTKRIDMPDLYTVLYEKWPSANIFLSDNYYRLCSTEDIKAFLAQDKTNRCQYEAERFDCDDFSYRLLGQFSIPEWSDLALGIVWTNLHALNLFVDENKGVWFLEPQEDKIQEKLSDWQGSEVKLIVI